MTNSRTTHKSSFDSRLPVLIAVIALLLGSAAFLLIKALDGVEQSDSKQTPSSSEPRADFTSIRLALQALESLPELIDAEESRQDTRLTRIDLELLDLHANTSEGELRSSIEKLMGAFSRYRESANRVRSLKHSIDEHALQIDTWMDRLEQFIGSSALQLQSADDGSGTDGTELGLTAAVRADWRSLRSTFMQQATVGLASGLQRHRATFLHLFTRSDRIRERLLLLAGSSDATDFIDRLDRSVLRHHDQLVQLEYAVRLLLEYFEQLSSIAADVSRTLERLQQESQPVAPIEAASAEDESVHHGSTLLLITSGLLVLTALTVIVLFLRRHVGAPLNQLVATITDSTGASERTGQDDWDLIAGTIGALQSELSAQRQAIDSSEERYRLLIENQGDMIVRLDPEGRFEFVSSTYCETFGKSLEELVGRASPITLLAKGRGEQGGTMMDLYRPPYECVLEQRSETTRGWRWISWNHKALRDDSGGVEAIVSVGRDVTDRKLAELELEGQRHFLHTVIDAVADPVMVIRRDYRLQMYNEAARRSFGLRGDADQQSMNGFCHKLLYGEEQPCQQPSHPCALHQVLQSGRPTTVLHLHETANGERTFELTASPYCDREGEILGVVQVSRDITEKLKAEDRIRFLAHHDALTGLPNRVLLRDRFHQAAQQADREGHSIALLFLDLDHFKHVNDTLGHKVGDRLLQQVVTRLSSAIRGSDTVSRLGGDEFVMVLPLRGEIGAAERISAHVLRILSEPFQIEGHELRLSASIGISRYPQDGGEFDDLLKNADSAMYVAKESGRNNCRFYQSEMSNTDISRLKLLNALQRALEKEDFNLLYQPQVELNGGRLVGFEALVNWQSRTLGRLRPGQFVSLAEESGLIVPLGNWVLRQACTQVAEWNRSSGMALPVAVNLSALQIRQESFVDVVVATLEESGLPAHLLELELTESILLQDTDKVLIAVKALQELGIRLTMDDFGTGYSSLSYLKKFNLTGLKIDRSFVADLTNEADDATIVRAIIQMGHGLGLTVIAEGVETLEQVAWLQQEGCERAQGYYFYKPTDAEGISRMLLPDGDRTEAVGDYPNLS